MLSGFKFADYETKLVLKNLTGISVVMTWSGLARLPVRILANDSAYFKRILMDIYPGTNI
jgi:hypothetical protein